MAKPIILNKKALSCACVILFVIAFGTFSVLAASLDVTYSDPKNDLRCFTQKQLEAFSADYEEPPENPDEMMSAIRELWIQGTLSSEPNYIDMILIRLVQSGANIKLIITVEGNVTDCDNVYILIWGNCSDGNGIAGAGAIQSGTGGGYDSYYVFVDADGNPLSNGTIDCDGGTMEMEFPASAWGNESCSLNILMATSLSDESLCADIFPNSVVGEPTGNELGVNILSDFWAALYYWFATNWWWLLIVACVVIVAVIAYNYYKKGQQRVPSKRTVK